MLHEEERKMFANIFSGRVSVITVISSYLEFKGLNIQQYQIELFGTQVDLSDTNQQRGRQSRPKHHTCKDHVCLDRFFLLSNLTWRRAHVTAGLTGRDPNMKLEFGTAAIRFLGRDTIFYGSAVHLNKTTKCRQF